MTGDSNRHGIQAAVDGRSHQSAATASHSDCTSAPTEDTGRGVDPGSAAAAPGDSPMVIDSPTSEVETTRALIERWSRGVDSTDVIYDIHGGLFEGLARALAEHGLELEDLSDVALHALTDSFSDLIGDFGIPTRT
jgi:hypothetical protein